MGESRVAQLAERLVFHRRDMAPAFCFFVPPFVRSVHGDVLSWTELSSQAVEKVEIRIRREWKSPLFTTMVEFVEIRRGSLGRGTLRRAENPRT